MLLDCYWIVQARHSGMLEGKRPSSAAPPTRKSGAKRPSSAANMGSLLSKKIREMPSPDQSGCLDCSL